MRKTNTAQCFKKKPEQVHVPAIHGGKKRVKIIYENMCSYTRK